jgi:hypothetical protein
MLRDPVSDWTVPRLHDLAKSRNTHQGCTSSGQQVAMATRFCTAVSNSCWCLLLELASWQPSGTKDFKVAAGFLEDFCASSDNVRPSQRRCYCRDLPVYGTGCS